MTPARPRNRRFAYYERLSAEGKRSYRRSDAISQVPLSRADAVRPLVARLREAMAEGQRSAVQTASARLVRALLEDLGVPLVDVEVLESRPRGGYGELHGLYTLEEGAPPRIQLWMRTAARGRVVAWKTFVRTLLHEVCHHLDYHHFDLDDSLHTQGFYRRETDLFDQIAGGLEAQAGAPGPKQLPLPGLDR